MALNDTITSSHATTTTYNPTVSVTQVYVQAVSPGKVWLEARVPSGVWCPLSYAVGVYSISSTDAAIEYRFNSRNVEDDVQVYLGP